MFTLVMNDWDSSIDTQNEGPGWEQFVFLNV